MTNNKMESTTGHRMSRGLSHATSAGSAFVDCDEAVELDMIRAQLQEKHRVAELPPWINAAGVQIWSDRRVRVAKLVLTNRFEMLMGLVIACNFCVIVIETDQDGSCFPAYKDNVKACPTSSSKLWWLGGVNFLFLIVYTVEVFLRSYVFRFAFFQDKWNYLDLLIVLTGWMQLLLEKHMNLSMLRVFRLARLFRAFRVFSRIRELYLLINGFASSCRAIFFGMIMLFGMLLVFSILLVELVHPINSQQHYSTCNECSQAFNSVYWSTLTLFREIIAGGSWIISTPVIKQSPSVGIVLVTVVVVISLGTMNLILAVIVERAAEARDKDVTDRIQQKDDEASEMKLRLLQMCAAMDKDESYTLTIDEIKTAYEELPFSKCSPAHAYREAGRHHDFHTFRCRWIRDCRLQGVL